MGRRRGRRTVLPVSSSVASLTSSAFGRLGFVLLERIEHRVSATCLMGVWVYQGAAARNGRFVRFIHFFFVFFSKNFFVIPPPLTMSVAQMILADKVVMFSWISCPFCVKAKQILAPLAPNMKVYECDQMSNGEDLRKQILAAYHHETVPAIFFNGQFIGGCDSIQQLQSTGELQKRIAAL